MQLEYGRVKFGPDTSRQYSIGRLPSGPASLGTVDPDLHAPSPDSGIVYQAPGWTCSSVQPIATSSGPFNGYRSGHAIRQHCPLHPLRYFLARIARGRS